MLPTKLNESLNKILDDTQAWSFPSDGNKRKRCAAAQKFFEWTRENVGKEAFAEGFSRLSILIAKADLTDRYQELRRQVNKRCRNHTSDRGHECIFHIWEQAYQQLEKLSGRLPVSVTFPELQLLKEMNEKDDNRPFATLVALLEED